jgi:hypothetical protein
MELVLEELILKMTIKLQQQVLFMQVVTMAASFVITMEPQ